MLELLRWKIKLYTITVLAHIIQHLYFQLKKEDIEKRPMVGFDFEVQVLLGSFKRVVIDNINYLKTGDCTYSRIAKAKRSK